MRIYIVGGPGSGKTDLARELSRRLEDCPVVHLDDYWDPVFQRDSAGRPTEVAVTTRRRLLDENLKRSSWIIEGSEPPFLLQLAEASDLILWCDVPFRVAAWRIVRRHVLADISGTNRYPGYRRLYGFVRSIRRWYDAPAAVDGDPSAPWTRSLSAQAAARHGGKTLRLRSGSAADNADLALTRLRPQAHRPG